jgi:hypothetical protein
MRHVFSPLLLLMAVSACAAPSGPVAEAAGAALRPSRGDAPAMRRAGLAMLDDSACLRSALDSPVAVQRLMAATFADGPAAPEARFRRCRSGFRAS